MVDKVHKKCISLASTCDCCSHRNKETINNVLATSYVTYNVWKWASALLNVPCMIFGSWKAIFLAWMSLAKKSSITGMLMGLMPCLITRFIWNQRCKIRMEGVLANEDQVCQSIQLWETTLAGQVNFCKPFPT